MKRILAIDQGTTATKSYTLDTDGHFVFCNSVEHRQIYPQPGWVEHDPEILLGNILTSIEAAIDIKAIGIDNQGETVIAWDGAAEPPFTMPLSGRTNELPNLSRHSRPKASNI